MTIGSNLTALGISAGSSITSGGRNTFLGYYAGFADTNGTQNTAIGHTTLRNNTSGGSNTAVGYYAVGENTTGIGNTGVGYDAIVYNKTGSYNTGVGLYSLFGNSNNSFNNNTAIGSSSLYDINTGGNNTAVGYEAGRSIFNGSSNIFLGFNAGKSARNVSSKLFISNFDTNNPLIGGDFSNKYINIYGNLQLNDNNKLQFGSNQNASITYTGTDLNINPKVAGTGKLNINGDLKIDGNIFFKMPHMFGIASRTQSPNSIGVWKGIDFNFSLGDNYGFSAQDSNCLIVQQTGHYLATYEAQFQDHSPVPDAVVALRISQNGVEVSGSYSEADTVKQDGSIEITTLAYIEAIRGDVLCIEWITSDIDVNLQTSNTYATQPTVAKGFIQWVHPDGM